MNDFPVVDSTDRLVRVVQELSLARSLERIVEIVRTSARQLTGADGATFVLRERGQSRDVCFYVDEDAIGPLWKGRRFPASSCISGWVMHNRRAAVVEDVAADPRIPLAVYAPTFVKSLVMVPIRSSAPIGAIGCYWAQPRSPSAREVQLLQALADSTSIAMENVRIHADLEARVAARTAELDEARAALALKNEELVALAQRREELSALVVHDIKGSATTLMLRAQQRMRGTKSPAEQRAWTSIYVNGEALARLATNLLDIGRSEDCSFHVAREEVRIRSILEDAAQLMQPLVEAREQRIAVQLASDDLVRADSAVIRRVLQNLIENAVAHNAPHGTVTIDAGVESAALVLSVSDEGSGIPADQRERIFDKYVRLPSGCAPHAGSGLGLCFCRMAVEAHGGRIWVEDVQPHGCRFCVRLPCPSGEAFTRAVGPA